MWWKRSVLVTAYTVVLAAAAIAFIATLWFRDVDLSPRGPAWLLFIFALIAVLAE